MRSGTISTRTVDRLKDDVYREMLRLEAGRPSAQILLAVGLLHAWMALEGQPHDCETRKWLRTLSPVCLRMIEEAGPAHDSGRVQEGVESPCNRNLESKKIL